MNNHSTTITVKSHRDHHSMVGIFQLGNDHLQSFNNVLTVLDRKKPASFDLFITDKKIKSVASDQMATLQGLFPYIDNNDL